MICEACGVEAETKKIEFYKAAGLVIIWTYDSVQGEFCKSCIRSVFWPFTCKTLLSGWWSPMTLIMTPAFLINNVVRYLFCLPMQPVPQDATYPELTDDAIARLQVHWDEINALHSSGEKQERIAKVIAPRAQTTEGQVVLYIRALIKKAKDVQRDSESV